MNTETGKRYTFEVYPTVLVPTAFDKVTMLVPSMPADIARDFTDIDSQHAAYLPTLQQGTPTQPDALLFCYVRLVTGEKVVLAHAWINQATVKLIDGVTITAVVQDESLETVETIRAMYAANGMKAVITTS